MKYILITFIIFSAFSINMFAKITLPLVFADNMVLQQNSKVAIWGWSESGETVRIVSSWNTKDTIKVKANNYSVWKTTIQSFAAGSPYSIQILGSSNIQLKKRYVGRSLDLQRIIKHGVECQYGSKK